MVPVGFRSSIQQLQTQLGSTHSQCWRLQEAVSSWIPGTRNTTNNKGGASHLGGSAARNLAQEGKRSLGAKSLFGVKMAPS